MNKLALVAAGSLAASVGFAQTLKASHDSVIETTGTYSADSTYFNVGLSGGKYNSFGVLDFNASSLATATLATATLTLTHSDYSSSKQTVFTVYAVTNNTVSVASGQTSLVYGTGAGYTDGLGSQFGTVTKLATFTYVPNLTSVNTTNTISLSNLSALDSEIASSSHDIRLVLTSDQLGEGTFFGVKGTTPPSLSVTTNAVPEPMTMTALGLGVAAFIRRRKKA